MAYRTSLLPLPGKDPDTFGVAFTVGDRLAVVEVVDAPEMEQLALDLAARQAACLAGNACEPVNLTSQAVAATPSASALATPVVGEAMVRTLMAATVEVPAEEHYVDLFRVGYAPGAVEQSHAATGPTLDLVTAGRLVIAVEGPAMVTRGEDPATRKRSRPERGDPRDRGWPDDPGRDRAYEPQPGEEPAVLLTAVILPVDAGPPPRAAGVTLLWLGGGVPAAAGRNAVTLERVTLAPGAAIPPPLLYVVASGSPEVAEDGGVHNTGQTNVDLLTLVYEPAPMPEEPASGEDASAGTPAATPVRRNGLSCWGWRDELLRPLRRAGERRPAFEDCCACRVRSARQLAAASRCCRARQSFTMVVVSNRCVAGSEL